MRESLLQRTSSLCSASVLALGLFAAGGALANPQGAVISAGSASISEAGSTLNIHQRTHRAVIDWRSFDIDAGEHTQFHQPSSAATALNRVSSRDPSRIAGTLSANGNVILINPNGVFFEGGSKVDVNSLIATTADVSNADFMAGKLHFNKPGNPNARIVNEGAITAAQAGLVELVAPQVENHGAITASLGTVHLASGDGFMADLYGDGLIKVEVSDAVRDQLVKNTGTISAGGGTVAITAATGRNIVNSLVSVEGELKAPTIAKRGGKIIIGDAARNRPAQGTVRVSGKVQAEGSGAGAKGGKITVTGKHVAIEKEAQLSANGHSGGGAVHIGGQYQGGGETATAEKTYIGVNATISADANYDGDGGEVIAWADDWTRFAGTISAQGGLHGGHGGFVETSGKDSLHVSGRVRVAGRHNEGQSGEWLLDPRNIVIQDDAAGAPDDTGTIDTDGPIFESDSDDDIVTTEAIEAALATANVTLQTGSGGAQDGDITVNDPISWSSNNSLTLIADDDINVNASLTNTGTGDITFTADGAAIAAAVTGNGGLLTIQNNDANTTIGIGAGAGTLSINDTELGNLSGWNGYIFGGSNGTDGTSGIMTIDTAHDFADSNVTFRAGADIDFDGTLDKASGAGTVNYVFETDGDFDQNNSSDITTSSGIANITINSDKNNSGEGFVHADTMTITSGGGNIIIGGGADPSTGSATSAITRGLDLNATTINAGGGNISIRGSSTDTTGNGLDGVEISGSSSIITTAAGTIDIIGVGGPAQGSNIGVQLSASSVQSQNGLITIHGTAGGDGTGDFNRGVLIESVATVEALGTGNITVTGIGGNGVNDNQGVIHNSTGSFVRVNGGNLLLDGTSSGSGARNYGVMLRNGADVYSVGAGSVTIDGNAPVNGDESVQVNSGGTMIVGGGSATGAITLIGDTMDLADIDLDTTGTLTIEEHTAGTTIDIGTDNGATLVIDDTELALMSAGAFAFGSADAGAVAFNSAYNFTGGNLRIDGASIDIQSALNVAANTLTLDAAAGNITTGANTLSAGTINFDAAGTITADVAASAAIDIGSNATGATLTGTLIGSNSQAMANLITGGPGNDASYLFGPYTIREAQPPGGGVLRNPTIIEETPELPVVEAPEAPETPAPSEVSDVPTTAQEPTPAASPVQIASVQANGIPNTVQIVLQNPLTATQTAVTLNEITRATLSGQATSQPYAASQAAGRTANEPAQQADAANSLLANVSLPEPEPKRFFGGLVSIEPLLIKLFRLEEDTKLF